MEDIQEADLAAYQVPDVVPGRFPHQRPRDAGPQRVRVPVSPGALQYHPQPRRLGLLRDALSLRFFRAGHRARGDPVRQVLVALERRHLGELHQLLLQAAQHDVLLPVGHGGPEVAREPRRLRRRLRLCAPPPARLLDGAQGGLPGPHVPGLRLFLHRHPDRRQRHRLLDGPQRLRHELLLPQSGTVRPLPAHHLRQAVPDRVRLRHPLRLRRLHARQPPAAQPGRVARVVFDPARGRGRLRDRLPGLVAGGEAV